MNNGWYQNPYGYGQGYGQNADRMQTGYGQYGHPAMNGYGQAPMPQNPPVQQAPMGLFDVIGQGTRVDWVQGESAMKSYTVRPGMSVILFDMENLNRVYVKAVNMAGVPIYTAGFDLGEIKMGRGSEELNDERYVPREEYEKSMNQIAKLFANLTKEDEYARKSEQTTRMGYESEQSAERAESERDSAGTGFPGV